MSRFQSKVNANINYAERNVQIDNVQALAKSLAGFLHEIKEEEIILPEADSIADRLRTVGAKNDMIIAKKARMHDALTNISRQVQEGKYNVEESHDPFPDFEALLKELSGEEQGGKTLEDYMKTGTSCKEISDTLQTEDDAEDSDDEIRVERQESDKENELKCPLTTDIFEEPMKSLKCNHNFSKAAVLSLFKNKNTIKCPVAGCSQTLSERDLEPNNRLKMKVERFHRKQQTQQSQPSAFDADCDVVE